MAAGQVRIDLMAVRAAIVLPQRERYSAAASGAIGLLVSRLTGPDDLVLGSPVDGAPLPGGRFVPVTRRGWGLSQAARYADAVARTLRALPAGERPERVEVHNRPEIARALRGRVGGAQLALFLHNDPQAMRRAKTSRERARLLRAMAVVCVSDWLRRRFLEGVGRGEVALLPNSLDADALPPALPVAERDPVILFVGRTVADKGADVFVAACGEILPQLPGWRAAMLGADGFGPDAPDTPFMLTLRPAAAAAGVELLGYRTHEETLAAIARAGIVAVPSRWPEPFGMTALEAMACGAPLVATATGGLPEVTGSGDDAAALIVPPGDAVALAGALLRLAGDPGLRERLHLAGLARAARFGVAQARATLAALRAAPPFG